MEILSTGEKIKRARIYKGATLKDICKDKVSVSKMSCIENDKIKPEKWIIEYVADKLELDVDYLMKDVEEQIKANIDVLKDEKFNSDVEEKLQYNLEYALDYNYNDLSFEIMHILFNGYIEIGKFENIQIINSKYYDLCQKSKSDNNHLVYYKDMARYLYMNKEYMQASTYYNSVRKYIREKNIEDYDMLSTVTYNEAACYMMLEDYERCYEVAVRLIDLLEHVNKDIKNAEIYHLLAILSLKMGKDNFEEYESKSYKYFKDDFGRKANAILNYATAMFEIGDKEKATEYVKNGLNTYPKDNKQSLVEYMLRCIEELTNNNILDEAQFICDETLNFAIDCDNIRYIERAYYFKSIILQKAGKYDQAEMYMNLSTDALFKYANKQERYNRYIEMGDMYHKLEEVNESIKYFTLALGLQKKM
ncbi:helix-turn-helix domain-containing protein [Clostridium sp. MSJ-4]|uniref:Helix-turn-helix domain-containing protein n=1 Tax=Clostridium simiarum TaxID=2841506 RepID=A0ABS6F312_9CLOT|nr:helix-turn-helix transcriptional regulator [Clostridium simiarum]MBU5592889.1 helix-turn-helix domain-containing protein [Clostridium simiarum]